MSRNRSIKSVALAGACLLACGHARAARLFPMAAAIGVSAPARSPQEAAPTRNATPGKLTVTVGKSLIIDSPLNIQRISVANGDLIEAVAVNPKEVLINGKAPGETSLVIWQQNGSRLLYDLTVRISQLRLEAVRQQLARDFPNDAVNVTYENESAFLRGTVKDLTAAERVVAMVSTLGKVVNLLRVEVPPAETQILLKVRFANVDRAAGTDLGVSFATGAFNQLSSVTSGQFGSTNFNSSGGFTLSDAMNILLFRKDINVAASIKALEARRLLETLAEPNVLAMNGKEASFLSGGEFPYPMIQGGSNAGAVTIAFRQFGVKINFTPTITPRGTIRLQVAPEVSSLDYNNAITMSGFVIPAIATRRVQSEVELESGQSFVIGGLLDNRTIENLSKIPGLSAIPLLGKLFQSRSVSKNNSELMVIVTPEVVRPISAGQTLPSLNMPLGFMPANTAVPIVHPGLDKTGPVAESGTPQSMPVEQLADQQRKPGQAAPTVIVPSADAAAPVPAAQPAPIAAPTGGGSGK